MFKINLGTADFIKKCTWSVTSFNGDYLSMCTQVAEGTFFMKSPVHKHFMKHLVVKHIALGKIENKFLP